MAVPCQGGLGKPECHAAQQHGFGQRTGVRKVGGGFAPALAGFDKLAPVAHPLQFREFEILELRHGIQNRHFIVRQGHDALGADDDGTGVRRFLTIQQGQYFGGNMSGAVVPGHGQNFAFGAVGAGEGVMNFPVQRPIMFIGWRAVGTDG